MFSNIKLVRVHIHMRACEWRPEKIPGVISREIIYCCPLRQGLWGLELTN